MDIGKDLIAAITQGRQAIEDWLALMGRETVERLAREGWELDWRQETQGKGPKRTMVTTWRLVPPKNEATND